MTRWTEAQLEAYIARSNHPTVQAPYMEPDSKHETAPKDAVKAAYPRYRITVHSKRRRLADADGICAKWVVDSLVLGGLIPDDSPEWVEAVTYTQEKAETEETIINVIMIGPD